MSDTDTNYMPAKMVRARYSVCGRTLSRWDKIGFPLPIVINHRRFWRLADLQAWERACAADRKTVTDEPELRFVNGADHHEQEVLHAAE